MKIKFGRIIQRPELVFVCIVTLFGFLSAIIMPILEVPDENQHFQIGYAIFSSDKRAPKDIILNEDMPLSAVRNGSYKNYYSHKTSAQKDGFAINTGSYVFDGKTKASVFDIMHIPQALGVVIGRFIYPSLGVMVLMGRIFNLALYVIVLYFIIKKIKYGKWTLVLVSSLPIMIQQAASLSYDGINLLAIFAWFAFIINLFVQKTTITKKQTIIGILLVLFLAITKMNNLLLVSLLLAMPAKLITKTKIFQRLRTSKHWSLVKYVAIILFSVALCIGMYLIGKKLLAGHTFDLHRLIQILLNTFFWGDLSLIDVTVNGMVGMFGSFYYHLPMWLVVIAFIVLSIVMLSERLPNISKRFAIISSLMFFGSIMLISIGMYYNWAMLPERLGPGAQIADGIQGRYFTPLLILLLPGFVYIQKYIKVVTKHKLTIPILATSTSTLLLVFYLLQTWHFFWK